MATIELIDYSPASFVLFGDGTKAFKEELKAVGGKWNGRLRDPRDETGNTPLTGWIFSQKRRGDVEDLLNKIQTGEVQPSPVEAPTQRAAPTRRAPRAPRTAKAAAPPVTTVPQGASPPVRLQVGPTTIPMQEVKYNVVRPSVGMKADISLGGNLIPVAITLATPSAAGFVDVAYAQPVEGEGPDKDTYKLAVIAGNWQVVGVIDEHSVTFHL